MANDDVLIIGKLDDDALKTSIDKLVNYVAGKTDTMANSFDAAMEKMKTAMKDFAVTQKVSVDLIKDAWKDMGASFDAMFDAEKRGSGGGKGSGRATYPDNTIGALEQEIALEEKKRKNMELGSKELRNQNLLIEQQNEELKKQKSLNTWAEYRKAAKDQFGAINALSTDSIPKAQKKLQELINLQNRYRGTKAFDEKQWNRLEAAIDNVRAKLERLKKKGAVGSTGSTYDTLVDIKNLMPENSIDEITAKMKALRQVKTQDAMETRALSDEYQRLKRRQHELMGSSVQLTKSNNYLAQSFGYIRNRIVYALTLGAISSFIKQVYEIRGQYELLERSLGVLVNSFERGSQVFNELNKMAIESPFTLMELAGGAKQLSAYNFEAKEVVDTTRRLADISAALGVPMERLVYNLGQIRAQTRLTARDARDFANAGLPIVGALAERFSNLEGKIVTTGDVYDRMTKKMVSYNDVMAVLNGMTDKGGKFFEFQAKQAETLRVQMANLTLATNNFLNEFGERNQGAISFFPKTLKAMLQEWRSINRVIKNVIISYGLLKLAQIVVLKGMTSMTWGMATTIATGNALTATITRLATAMKSLFLNPWTGAFVAILAIIDAIGRARANAEALVDLNDKIREGAVESTDNTNKFLTNKGNVSTRELAKENKLTAEQGEKAWEQIRQQIEQSAMSSNNLIGKLLEIDDINERVRKGFEYTEAINKATAALADLGDKEIKITRDKGWFGLFGEGLVKDLKDLKEELGGIGGQISMFTKEGKVNADLGIGFKEYAKELEITANDIKNFLDVHKIKDPLQIQEILSRVKEIIKQKNPEIKGELATLFDVTLDQRVNFLTNGAIDNNASLWAMFMERLKHNSSATFQGITNDWVKNSDKLSKEQQDAVDENLEYFKKTMPFYYDTIKSMVDDASKLKIQIGIAFNVMALSDFQKQVKERIKANEGVLDFGNETMWGTSEDNLESWVDTRQKAIKALRAENKLYEKDDSDWAKEKIKNNNAIIEQNKNLLDLFHQSYEADKKSNKGSKKTDVLGDALKKEVELIDNIQKRYKEYEKMGVDSQTAITKATEEYGNTLKSVNLTLSKYGIKTKTSDELAGMDLRAVRDYLKTLLDYAKALGNAKGVEAIEKSLAKINVDITKVDYKRITDGLNNELGKLKDEYELAIELDANPELGGMFADMLGINVDELPHTFAEAFERANNIVKQKLRELKVDTNGFDLMSSVIKADDSGKWMGLAFDSDAVKELIKIQKTWREAFKKNLVETEKSLDDYVKKYGDYSDKIAEIEADRLERITKLNDAYFTEQMRQSPDYLAKMNAINAGAEREKGQVKWEEFKNSTMYITMFENLEYASTRTLEAIHEKLTLLKGDMGSLEPEQLKQVTDQYLKIEQQLLKRNPFKGLSKNAKEYAKAIGSSGRAAQNSLKNAQARYDAELEVVTQLKTQKKQMESNNQTDSEAYKMLLQILAAEETELGNRREALRLAAETVEKYDLMRKIFKEQSAAIGKTFQTIGANLQSLGELRDTLNSLFGVDASKGETLLGHNVDGMIDGLAKAGNAISSIVSSATSGNVFGVINGVVGVFTGIGDSIASIFGDGAARTRRINKEINESVERVRKLSMAYKELEAAVEKEMGEEELRARRAEIANKKQQLAELERQMQLEKSKRSKDRDDDKIKDYEESIQDIRLELKELADDIANTLLGTSVKDAAEDFVSTWVDAWRAGDNTLDAIGGKFDDMIDNMIMKSLASKVVANRIQKIWDMVDAATQETSEGGASLTINELQRIKALIGDKSIGEAIDEDLRNLYGVLGIAYGSNAEKSLSALQQGIQGVTEDTAGAIEAYMNGVSQQVYLQSDLLREIRDVVIGFDSEFQMATLGEILLQLRSSYEMQMAIHAMMEGWTTPSGNGIRVELLS